jgi:hypothetical protein
MLTPWQPHSHGNRNEIQWATDNKAAAETGAVPLSVRQYDICSIATWDAPICASVKLVWGVSLSEGGRSCGDTAQREFNPPGLPPRQFFRVIVVDFQDSGRRCPQAGGVGFFYVNLRCAVTVSPAFLKNAGDAGNRSVDVTARQRSQSHYRADITTARTATKIIRTSAATKIPIMTLAGVSSVL